jgi:trehalose/maltose hydrolase-like predicted phosphorylase
MKLRLIFFSIIAFQSLLGKVYSQNDEWNITTTKSDNYTGVVVSNGQLGILPSKHLFGIEHVILNNVYDLDPYSEISRILQGMNFGNLEMEIDGEKITDANIRNWKQTLNMREARIITSFSFKDEATISYSIYALRNVPNAGYIDIKVEVNKEIAIKVTGKISTPSSDYQKPKNTYKLLKDSETTMPVLQSVALSSSKNHKISTSATFIWHDINSSRENRRPELTYSTPSEWENCLSFEKKINKGDTLEFAWAAAECSDKDFTDPKSESERIIIFNLLTARDVLLQQHKNIWNKLWEGDIIIEGDLQAQQDVRLALYHLYSFGRGDNDLSIAPMGLSVQVPYNGHIFWDTELWMFPPLLVLNQDIARSLVNYRFNHLDAAKRKARTYGYQGAMFPWESDDTGEEATPPFALPGTFEHHITADIAIAFWNYYRVTKDKIWLKEKGYPLLKEVADFWVSRAFKNNDGSYSIKNVIGANEFAANIDDNAFTNGSAITALNYATHAATELTIKANPEWKTVADKIVIHRFKDGTTMEHSKYTGDKIKQADANLLSYPLDIVNDKETILKDLKYYEPKLAVEGPAMGKSIFAVIYARLGDTENAYRLFKQSYEPNKRSPFGALSESAIENNSYFATGAGGMLQVVLFGFGGLHFTDNGIIQKDPILPKEWKSLTIKGVGIDKKTFVVKGN